MTVYLTKDAILDFNTGPRLFYLTVVATDNGSPPQSGTFIVEREAVWRLPALRGYKLSLLSLQSTSLIPIWRPFCTHPVRTFVQFIGLNGVLCDFGTCSAVFNVYEELPIGSPVYLFNLTDPENLRPLRHYIIAGNDNNGKPAFSMNETTGVVTVASRINFEQGPTEYVVWMRAVDTPRPLFFPAITERNITLRIVDSNEPPSLGSAPSFAFDENTLPLNRSTVGTVVYTVVAADSDIGQNYTYTIVSGNTNNAFRVRAELMVQMSHVQVSDCRHGGCRSWIPTAESS